MPAVKNRLPPLPELRARFIPDYEAGTLTLNPDFKGNAGRSKRGERVGSRSPGRDGRVRVNIAGVLYPIARILWAMHSGRDPGQNYIDHIDGNPSNNTIHNLRSVTPGENRINSVASSNTGRKGVTVIYTKTGEPRYRVQICRVIGRGPVGEKGSRDGCRRKTYTFGHYKTLEEACARYAQIMADWGLTDFTRPEYMAPPKTLRLPDQCDEQAFTDFAEFVGLGAK